jgi:predicted glycosyltransferase
MRVLIDVGHPGHVHLFRPLAKQLIRDGGDVLFTCRQKEFEIELLEAAGFRYVSFGKHYKTKSGKIFGFVKFNIQLLFIAIRFRPTIFLSHGSIYAAVCSFLLRKDHISMEDSGNMEQIRLYRPFTKVILTPEELPENLGEKQLRYPSYHEIAYLGPKYFSPDKKIIEDLGISQGENYALLRFVSWNATHDKGQGGFTTHQKTKVVKYLSSKMKLFISSEGEVPEEFKPYLIKIRPEQMHHVLAYARIVVSEGATMASEAGVLGTPAVYVNSLARCYNEDQERLGTVTNFRNGNGVIEKVKELLKEKEKPENLNKALIEEKIDLTAYLYWFVNNWPDSLTKIADYPEFKIRN